MEKKKKPFLFLSDAQFLVLSFPERAIYLSLAAQELEERQKKLREQMMLDTINKQQE